MVRVRVRVRVRVTVTVRVRVRIRVRVRGHRHKHAVGEEYVEHLDANVVPPVARLATTLDRRAHRLPAQGDQG